jgi:phosphotransferase system HPr (HPr) family protein
MQREVEIVNELGLHARPAAEFVRCARDFESEITIQKEGQAYAAKSIIEVLTANLDCGTRIELEAIGPDEREALEQLAALLQKFRDDELHGKQPGGGS